MKVTDYFNSAQGRTLLSFEVLPPLKGGSIDTLFQQLDPLMEFKPPFIDVTYHREEFVYKEHPSGHFEKIAIRKRPGTVGICAAIMNRYKVEAVPHLICGGFSREETENALIDLHFLQINNVLALRGDARKFDEKFIAEKDGHEHAVDLVKQIAALKKGIYLDKDIESGTHMDFCIGIAGYPEKHFEAASLKSDLKYTRKKIEAGADYIVTQMFFDNKKFFDYVALCREEGIEVPIVPGIKPITRKYQLNAIPRNFFVDMPDELVRMIQKAKTDEAVVEAGIEWCIYQSVELKKAGVPCIHYYTMSDSAVVRRVAEKVV
ncbi:MAG: methylenetetrahydrofolate reductase [NAD(P)H] [Saprospiraceae bacterium]|nr:methylenetetrahydrofolate reductase [NAD(P)H] [Saprospiraceae bacterium]HMX89645.1 methylenetetrahydrofolate reductase [NAD(P)H] [Saprospiraceae bacterium]HMZ40656.1 methylenetetrahydrofolate reductase [NAD(P)H] [Saprospiraceae bacterium]HNA65240.1 methylenetetrahydrofolate reductase [NAD(P)H] [Saprospiraceae bacterium]HNC37588.1 methylenetetrahydrofolate reductase [NAD(P)H] [Saprospiraceae bacterium]